MYKIQGNSDSHSAISYSFKILAKHILAHACTHTTHTHTQFLRHKLVESFQADKVVTGNGICKNKEQNKPKSNHSLIAEVFISICMYSKSAAENLQQPDKHKCNSLSTISSLRSINYSVNVHTFTSVISVLFNSCEFLFLHTLIKHTYSLVVSPTGDYHLAYITHRYKC